MVAHILTIGPQRGSLPCPDCAAPRVRQGRKKNRDTPQREEELVACGEAGPVRRATAEAVLSPAYLSDIVVSIDVDQQAPRVDPG